MFEDWLKDPSWGIIVAKERAFQKHSTIDDRNTLLRNTSLRMDLFQYLEDVALERLRRTSLLSKSGLLGILHNLLRCHLEMCVDV